MLQIQEVHKHLVLNNDFTWEKPIIKFFIRLRFAINKRLNIERCFTVIIRNYEVIVANEKTHNSIKESVSYQLDGVTIMSFLVLTLIKRLLDSLPQKILDSRRQLSLSFLCVSWGIVYVITCFLYSMKV